MQEVKKCNISFNFPKILVTSFSSGNKNCGKTKTGKRKKYKERKKESKNKRERPQLTVSPMAPGIERGLVLSTICGTFLMKKQKLVEVGGEKFIILF